MDSMAFLKFSIKSNIMDSVNKSDLGFGKMDIIECGYLISTILSECNSQTDLWTQFPPFLFPMIEEVAARDIGSFPQNLAFHAQVEEKYPLGHAALKAVAFKKLIL